MTILKCPTCYLQGTKQNLAEIMPDGGVKILRSNPYQQDFTIIHGQQFSVSCGKCNTIVFYKQPKILDNQITRDLIITNTMTFYGTFI